MGDKTGIAWTDATWNAVRGCSRVSPGCVQCYAEKRAYRILQQQKGMEAKAKREGKTVKLPLAYDGTVRLSGTGEARWTGEIQLAPHLLDQPLRWTKPRLIFVASMSDPFHKNVPFEYVAAVYAVMAATPRHTYQVLTKRPERAVEFYRWLRELRITSIVDYAESYGVKLLNIDGTPWPLKNVWLGTSIESDKYRAERLAALRKIPNAMPWVSQEPQIGEVTYTKEELSWLRWIVVGGESGTKDKVRPFNIEWARSTIKQCADTGVACFVKQMGTVPYQDDEFPEETPYAGVKLIAGVEKPGLCFPGTKGKKGGDMEKWPSELRVREYPNVEELLEVA